MSNKSVSTKQSLLAKISNGFENLERREQYLLLIAVPATVVLVIFLLFIEPEIKNAQRLEQNLGSMQRQLELAQQSNQELLAQAQIDPDVDVKQQIKSLEARLATLNQQFEGELNQLVTPQAMPGLLEELFENANDLSLISMKSIAPNLIEVGASQSNKTDDNDSQSTSKQAKSSQSNQFPIYRHGIEITFEGSFFATRDFLANAEALSWKLYWQDLSYSVGEHPKAVTQLTLFTLSTSEAFIGVY